MKKYIIFALVAILAAVLFVACDDDVMLDNNTAYTEILEADKAFVANGKGYDTLQEAIDAALGKGSKGLGSELVYAKVSLTKDIASRGASISGTDAKVEIDLNGHTLSFADVKDSALVVEEGTALRLSNGKVTLIGKAENLKVVAADHAAKVELNNTAVETADGQFALSAVNETVSVWVKNDSVINGDVYIENGTFHLEDSVIAKTVTAVDATVYFEEGALVTGDVTVYGEDGAITIYPTAVVSSNIAVTGKATLESNSSDVYGTITVSGANSNYIVNADNKNVDLTILDNATVTVNNNGIDTNGIVKVVEVDDSEWKIFCYGDTEAQIIDASETPLDPSHFQNSFCYVLIDGERHYTETLSEAIELAYVNKTEVVYMLDHVGSAEETISRSVTIDLNGRTEEHDLSIADGVTLTLKSSAAGMGTVSGKISGDGNLETDSVIVSGTIWTLASLKTSKSEFENTINNVGTVEDVGYSEFNRRITTTGSQTYKNTAFLSKSDLGTLDGSTITLTDVLFAKDGSSKAFSVSANEVSLVDCTGTVGAIETVNSSEVEDKVVLSVSNSAEKELEISMLYAKGYGSINVSSAGSVEITGDNVSDTQIGGVVAENGNVNLSTTGTGTIEVAVEAEGTSNATALAILTSGNINVVNNGSSISLAGSDSEANDYTYGVAIYAPTALTGEQVEVEVVNNKAQASVVICGETVAVLAGTYDGVEFTKVSDVNFTNVSVSGKVVCKDLISNGSLFTDTVIAESVTDGTNSSTATGSTFEKGISATGILNFYGSTFGKETNLLALSGYAVQTSYVNETAEADVTVINMVGVNFLNGTGATHVRATGTTTGDYISNTMSIRIQDATGVSGNISAADGNIVIDNDNGTSTIGNFATGTLNADSGLVDVEGHATSEAAEAGQLVIGGVHAKKLHSHKTIFDGTVFASDRIEDGVVLNNSGSKFKSGVTSAGTASFEGSTFDASNGSFTVSASSDVSMADVMFIPHKTGEVVDETVSVSSTTSTVSITKGLGTAGAITAAGQIAVDNSEYTGASSLTTGVITAKDGVPEYFDVTIKGNSTSPVSVTRIDYAKDVTTSYAIIGFVGSHAIEDHVVSLTDSYSTIIGDVTTTGAQVYNNSVFDSSDVDLNGYSITINAASGTVGKITSTTSGILITSSDTENLALNVRGKTTSAADIILKDGTNYDAGTLNVWNDGYEFDASGEIHIYGGTYGSTEYGVGFDYGDIFIHKGDFYVGNAEELSVVTQNIYHSTSYPVNIHVFTNITLTSPVVVGYKNSQRVPANKPITFDSVGSKKLITVINYGHYISTNPYVYDYYYTNYPIDVKAGAVKFKGLDVTLDQEFTPTSTTKANPEDYPMYVNDGFGSLTWEDCNLLYGEIKHY